MTADDVVADLLAYIDRSPTPYHAVAESARRLEAGGWHPLAEDEAWELAPGARRYVVRGDGSLAAFQCGSVPPAEAGFRVIGAHTDSPNLRLKPLPDDATHGYRRLGCEIYGGVLLHTWLDRDLSLAGRVVFGPPEALRTALVDFERPLLCVPNLAIHLNRDVTKEGLKLDPQQHLVPVVGLEDAPPLKELLATELRASGFAGAAPDTIRSFDLMTYDVQPSCVAGARGEFVLAPRLDNLASCHAAVCALLDAAPEPCPATRVVVLYDHEEVGSRSATGAGGTLLRDLLERTATGAKDAPREALSRALALSTLVSADMAHAVHPNYADRHDAAHRPLIGKGPVIKVNAGQAYASDAASAGVFAALCAQQGIEPQWFASRSDLPCGSTIGPISAARVGLETVDVGNPMLSMHSCREMAGSADVAPMIDVLAAFLRAA